MGVTDVPGQAPLLPLDEGYQEVPAQEDPDKRTTQVTPPFKPKETPKGKE